MNDEKYSKRNSVHKYLTRNIDWRLTFARNK